MQGQGGLCSILQGEGCLDTIGMGRKTKFYSHSILSCYSTMPWFPIDLLGPTAALNWCKSEETKGMLAAIGGDCIWHKLPTLGTNPSSLHHTPAQPLPSQFCPILPSSTLFHLSFILFHSPTFRTTCAGGPSLTHHHAQVCSGLFLASEKRAALHVTPLHAARVPQVPLLEH